MICLQGGAEFGAAGARMDADLVRTAAATGRSGPIVITALAGAPGREYDTANRNGVRHFAALVADVANGPGGHTDPLPDVVAAPDARSEPTAALALVSSARMVVLPGGSPSRLLDALRATGLDVALRELLAAGAVVMGASAGAMVLCERTWLPDAGGRIVDGLGAVPGALVLPHWTPGSLARLGANGGAGDGITVLGLPEQSGVLVADGTLTAVGRSGSTVIRPGGSEHLIPVGTSAPAPPTTHLG